MRASVIVPVYDPGPDLDRCVGSILGQTLRPTDVEAIFVDDGSTDSAPARLDAIAATHANVKVVHTPNSGWPGRPRNIGLDLATGDYVHFVDQDDTLALDAMERLVEMADRCDADIVIGKESSDFRAINQSVYREDRETASLLDAPIIETLTPHKLFRRDFLVRNALRFPEGKRRLEDQLFVVHAYVAASNIAILASHPCYFYLERSDRSNAGAAQPEPRGYYANVREIVDVILAHVGPGADRDRLVRRFVRQEILYRLTEPLYLELEPAGQRAIVEAIQPLLRDLGTLGVVDGLQPLTRLRARLAGDGHPEALARLASRMNTLQARVRIDGVEWTAGHFEVRFRADMVDARGRPVVLEARGDRLVLDPALTDGVTDAPLDVTDDQGKIRVQMAVVERTSFVEWRAPATTTVELVDDGVSSAGARRVIPQVHGVANLDAGRLALGKPLQPGCWEARLRLHLLGVDRRTVLGDASTRAWTATLLPTWAGDPPRTVRLTTGGADRPAALTLVVDPLREPVTTLLEAMDDGPIEAAPGDGSSVVMHLPLSAASHHQADHPARLLVTTAGGASTAVPATITAVGGRVTIRAAIHDALRRHPAGPVEIAIATPAGTTAGHRLASGTVDRHGRLWLDGARRLGTQDRLRAIARAGYDRLPASVRRRVRAVVRR